MRLTSNQLKLLAMVTMTLDHIGVALFPGTLWLRMVGRLAMPIYAWMIAEGCVHTKNRRNYLLQLAGMALLCQLVYVFAMGSLFQCILVTFTLSVVVIYAIDSGSAEKAALALCAALFITVFLPRLLPNTDFAVDYSIWGVLLPVAVYIGKSKWEKLLLAAIVLVVLAFGSGPIQLYSLLSLALLALYNGKRGKGLGKYFFYIYYPLHLVIIEGIAYLR